MLQHHLIGLLPRGRCSAARAAITLAQDRRLSAQPAYGLAYHVSLIAKTCFGVPESSSYPALSSEQLIGIFGDQDLGDRRLAGSAREPARLHPRRRGRSHGEWIVARTLAEWAIATRSLEALHASF